MYQRHETESSLSLDRWRLIELGVPDFLLKPGEFNFSLLLERLFVPLRDNVESLKITHKWQLEALSGDPRYYHLIKERKNFKDTLGLSPFHYTAWSGNIEALDWIYRYFPDYLVTNDFYGKTPLDYAANSGNIRVLDWINTKFPKFFLEFTKEVASMLNCLARSGSIEALNWVYHHFPQYLFLRGFHGITALHYVALSNPQALNHALSLSQNPSSWELIGGFKATALEATTNNLVKALETNYTLTAIKFNSFSLSEDSELFITSCLSRNIQIKNTTMRFMVFLQGLTQITSEVSTINFGGFELCLHILSHLLPKNTDLIRVFNNAFKSSDKKHRALALIDKVIENLQTNLPIFGIPSNWVLDSGQDKITSLKKLKQIIEVENTCLKSKVLTWQNESKEILSKQRIGYLGFFNSSTTSQDKIERVTTLLL